MTEKYKSSKFKLCITNCDSTYYVYVESTPCEKNIAWRIVSTIVFQCYSQCFFFIIFHPLHQFMKDIAHIHVPNCNMTPPITYRIPTENTENVQTISPLSGGTYRSYIPLDQFYLIFKLLFYDVFKLVFPIVSTNRFLFSPWYDLFYYKEIWTK